METDHIIITVLSNWLLRIIVVEYYFHNYKNYLLWEFKDSCYLFMYFSYKKSDLG